MEIIVICDSFGIWMKWATNQKCNIHQCRTIWIISPIAELYLLCRGDSVCYIDEQLTQASWLWYYWWTFHQLTQKRSVGWPFRRTLVNTGMKPKAESPLLLLLVLFVCHCHSLRVSCSSWFLCHAVVTSGSRMATPQREAASTICVRSNPWPTSYKLLDYLSSVIIVRTSSDSRHLCYRSISISSKHTTAKNHDTQVMASGKSELTITEYSGLQVQMWNDKMYTFLWQLCIYKGTVKCLI